MGRFGARDLMVSDRGILEGIIEGLIEAHIEIYTPRGVSYLFSTGRPRGSMDILRGAPSNQGFTWKMGTHL